MNIRFELSKDSIKAAVNALKAYQKRIEKYERDLRLEVAHRLAEYAQQLADSAEYGSVIDNEGNVHSLPFTFDVSVADDGRLVVAHGDEVAFIEFGAGVYYNGAVGTSPHPKAGNLTIGSYGKGKGAQETWAYMDENGEFVYTHGTIAQMPMYKALLSIAQQVPRIAKEVAESL